MTLCMKRTKMRKYGHIFLFILFFTYCGFFCLFLLACFVCFCHNYWIFDILWVRLPYHVCFFLVKIIRSYFYFVNAYAHGRRQWMTLLMMMTMMTKLGKMMTSVFAGHADLGRIQIWPPYAVARRPAWKMIIQGCRIIHTNFFYWRIFVVLPLVERAFFLIHNFPFIFILFPCCFTLSSFFSFHSLLSSPPPIHKKLRQLMTG